MKDRCNSAPFSKIPCIVIRPRDTYDFSVPNTVSIKAPVPTSINKPSNWAVASHTTSHSSFAPSILLPFIPNLPKSTVISNNASGNNFLNNTSLVSKPILKEFIEYTKKQGIDTTDIATDKGSYEYLKNGITVSWKLGWGYFKCSTYLDYIIDGIEPSDIAYEAIIRKYGKKIPGLHFYTCAFQAADEAFITPEAVNLAGKAIELIEK